VLLADFPPLDARTKLGGRSRQPSQRAKQAHRLAVDGTKLINQGRHARGAALLAQSIALDPNRAATHHDLGIGLLAVGRIDEAGKAFAAAVRLDPQLASAHYNLGFALDSLGRAEHAMAAYEAAVRLKLDLPAAQSRLGDLYFQSGRRREAAAAFRAAAQAGAASPWARISEARALDAEGATEEAIAALRQIVTADPTNGQAHACLGRMLAQSGESADAAAHLELAATLAPEMILAWYGVATNRNFTRADQPLIGRMNASLARPNLTPLQRSVVHFALGKAHDDIGDCATAIRHFDAANRIRSKYGSFDGAALARRVDRLIAGTPPGFASPAIGVADPTPILIVGLPRSGTTLVEQILSSHPAVAAGGELTFWAQRDTAGVNLPGLSGDHLKAVADDCLAELRAISPTAARVTDKMPFNFGLLGAIHRILPRATFIHCRRHPIDTCLSIYFTSFESSLDFAGDRRSLVAFYRQYERLMVHWREVLPPDRLIEVDYEALVADPELITRRLIAACGLEWDDVCLSPQRNRRQVMTASMWQARQPIYKSSVERWRRYEPWLGELRQLDPEAQKA
jgi:tetratricopeptide (TPR) repeat protein